jgi:subtilisin family serine protease
MQAAYLPVKHRSCLFVFLVFLFSLTACGGGGESADPLASVSSKVIDNGGSDSQYDVVNIDADGWAIVGQEDSLYSAQACRNCGARTALADGVLVSFRNTSDAQARQASLSSAGCSQVAKFDIAGNLGAGLTHARIVPGQTINQTLQSLLADPAVEFAEPNYVLTTQNHVVPNDPRFNQLWGLNNTAQPGADANVMEAWHTQTGGDVVVAVIDSGLALSHREFTNNVWVNPNEIRNNGIDDDGNGYVDDWRGWDFVNNDNYPLDDNDHGSHTSGTIAAQGDNGIGVVGVNWRAKIMPLKFMNNFGRGTIANAIQAIEYAVANGAKISNHSWGGTGFSTALSNAIAAANRAGHLVVAAAGNSGNNSDNLPIYPAAYNLPNIISVAATDRNDRLATFSNFGARSVDLGAPGVDIVSTIRNSNYASFSGTSMATPHVTGAAALLLAQNPVLTAAQLKAAIMNSVDPIAALNGRSVSGGRLNITQALAQIAPAVNIDVTPANGQLEIGQTLQFTAAGGTAPYSWSVDNPAVANINANGVLTALNAGTVQVTATDANGDSGSSGNITITIPVISVSPGNPSIAQGQTIQMAASGGNAPFSWSVANPSVATISANGLLAGLAGGVTQVTATDANGISGSTQVTITQLMVSPDTATLAVGQTLQFTATDGVVPYSWSVDNTAVASINATTGLLTAANLGAAQVTVTDNTGRTNSTGNITVVDTPVIAIANTVMGAGDSQTLSAAGGLAPYTWGSSNPSVASVNANGFVSALAAGATSITVTDSMSNSDSTTITVKRVTVAPQLQAMVIGDSVQFNASGGTMPYSWSVSDAAVASVDANGLLTALAQGSVQVTAMDADGISGTSASIAVNAVIITVTAPSANVSVGANLQFTASGGSAPYTWAVDDAAVASINASGLLSGLAAGTVTVIATDANGNMGASALVTVSAVTITVTPNTADVNRFAWQRFFANGGTAPYTFSLSNPNAGFLNSSTGWFRATGAVGAATTIVVTDADGNVSESGTVTVVNTCFMHC